MVKDLSNLNKNTMRIQKYTLAFLIMLTSLAEAYSQTPITVCPQNTTFTGMTRGYYFTAPANFTICGIYVEDDASTLFQSAAIVRFTSGPPPAYAAVTNNFVTLWQNLNYAPNNMISVPNIQINAGDVIGIYGSRGANSVNSYGAAQCVINIQSIPTTTFRSGMQFDLAAGPGMHDIWSENNGSIGRVTMYTNCCPAPTALPSLVGDTVVCQKDTTTYTVPSQAGAVTYTWSVPPGAFIISGQGTPSATIYWNSGAGGQVCATWTDSCTASPPVCINVNVNPTPLMAPTNITACAGDTIPASNFLSNPVGATYTWSNSNTAIGLAGSGTGNTPAFIAANTTNTPDTSIVTVTPTLSGCEGSPYTYMIIVNPTPVMNPLANLIFCAGDTVPSIIFSGNTTNTYSWANSDTTIGLAVGDTGNIPLFIATNTGSTAIISTITVTPSANGCLGIPFTFTITVNPNNLVAGPGSLVCLGDSIVLTAANSGLGTITWYDDPNGTNVIGTGTPFYPTVNDTGTYVFYVNEVGGCATNLDSVVVVVKGVNAFINATPITGLIPLDVFFGNGSTTGPGVSYMWDFGTGDTSNVFEPTYTYNADGTYTVMLVVTDGFCFDTAYVIIEAIKESIIIIPNVFTPNGDGSNDVFKLQELNLKTVEGEVYNRWGQKLYSWNELNGSWDGNTSSGDPAPAGTYFYLIKATGEDGVEYLKKGSFSLMR